MESIENLRRYGHDCCARIDDAIKELADAIEVEHDIELNRQYNKGYNAGYDVGYDVGFANADDWLADNEAAMEEHGWVKLPVDADGEVIHVGDDMETLMVGHEGDHSRVEWVSLTADGWDVDGEPPTSMRHYHEPTVESTLREMLAEIGEGGVYAEDVLLAKYAAKFRLAGDGE